MTNSRPAHRSAWSPSSAYRAIASAAPSKEELTRLRGGLSYLDDLKAQVLTLAFGLNKRVPELKPVSEVAEELGLTTDTASDLLHSALRRVELRSGAGISPSKLSPAAKTRNQLVAQSRAPGRQPSEVLLEHEAQGLRDWLSFLSRREAQVLALRFGLDGRPTRTNSEVARILKMGQSQVSTTLRRAGERIRLTRAPVSSGRRSAVALNDVKAVREFLGESVCSVEQSPMNTPAQHLGQASTQETPPLTL